MAISTGTKIGIAWGGAATIVIVAGVVFWNRAAPPKDEVSVEASTQTSPLTPITSRPAGVPLFTVSPKTTGITSPVHDDGTPDYLAALNNLVPQDLTADTNVLAGWVTLVGAERFGDTPALAPYLAKLGIGPSDPSWTTYYDYADKHGHPEKGAASQGPDDEQLARQKPWKSAAFPLVAAYLDERHVALDAAIAIWSRPHYWSPVVSSDGRSLLGLYGPTLGLTRELADDLVTRAQRRAGEGDFDGCLSDIHAARHFAAMVAVGPAVLNRLVAYAIDDTVNRALAGCAASGILSVGECQKLAEADDSTSPLPDLTGPLETCERWSPLDTVLLIAIGRVDVLEKTMGRKALPTLQTIDVNSVDWDTVLTEFNTLADEWVTGFRSPLLEDMQAAGKKLWVPSKKSMAANLSPADGESRQQYTARVTAYLVRLVGSSLTRDEEIRREDLMRSAMARALVAAAAFHARTGAWPRQLQDVLSADFKTTPVDIYVPGGATPVLYLLNPNGPTLYSVGPNHRDDGGVRDNHNHDDIAVGAPISSLDLP